jgi:hypothetical protein
MKEIIQGMAAVLFWYAPIFEPEPAPAPGFSSDAAAFRKDGELLRRDADIAFGLLKKQHGFPASA